MTKDTARVPDNPALFIKLHEVTLKVGGMSNLSSILEIPYNTIAFWWHRREITRLGRIRLVLCFPEHFQLTDFYDFPKGRQRALEYAQKVIELKIRGELHDSLIKTGFDFKVYDRVTKRKSGKKPRFTNRLFEEPEAKTDDKPKRERKKTTTKKAANKAKPKTKK